MNYSITVIIPTYNGASKIEVLLEALKQQTLIPAEIIVVVDGSTDNTLEVLKKFGKEFPSLRIISQQNKGRSAARNSAARSATADLLIFFDDDKEPDLKCIEKHLAFHLCIEFECLLCGNIEEQLFHDGKDIQNYKTELSRKWIDEIPQGVTRFRLDNLFFSSANCSVKKEVFTRLRMFDERLHDAEDHDLGYRALEVGIPVFFDKDNRAVHHERITCKSYIMRLRSYRTAHQKLATLHPDRIEKRLGNSPGFLKRCLYWFFARSIFVRWIDEEKLKFLPRKTRYSIYTLVIHSLANVFPETSI
jgi:glycosyltransferase involved in cell wall biosynthesis